MSASLRFSDGVRELFVAMRRIAAFVCFKLRFMCMCTWSKFHLDLQVRFCSVAFSEEKKCALVVCALLFGLSGCSCFYFFLLFFSVFLWLRLIGWQRSDLSWCVFLDLA